MTQQAAQKADLNDELDRLEGKLPGLGTKLVRRVRSPAAAPYRIPIGLLLIVGGLAGFLPILGFWMIPLGLAVMAQDIKFLRPGIAKVIRWINNKLPDRDGPASAPVEPTDRAAPPSPPG